MKKLSFDKKRNISAGAAASTIAWIAIIGASMLFSGINSFVNSLTSSSSSNSHSSYSASGRQSMMLRLSPIPSRSTLNFWI